MKLIKILYIEDKRSDVEIVERTLKRSGLFYKLKAAENKQTFEELLDQFQPDLILSDHSLYQFDSLEAFKIVRAKNLNIPFILVTGSISEEFAIKILKTGARDYVLKTNLSRLPIAISNTIKEMKIEEEKLKYQKQLEEKNKDLNTLIYKITHDLRAPLCSIIGLTEIAQKESGTNKYFNKIAETANKLDTILISLTDTIYTRDSAIVSEEIDFGSIIHDIKMKYLFIKQYEDIQIKYSVKKGKTFYSDKKIIESILQNIIENSCKYKNRAAKESIIDIQIKFDNESVFIIISDNGIGIDPVIQDKVFDMFYRGNTDSTGSGLGLYLVKIGVEKLKGKIHMESQIKKGTKFSIIIPYQKKS